MCIYYLTDKIPRKISYINEGKLKQFIKKIMDTSN